MVYWYFIFCCSNNRATAPEIVSNGQINWAIKIDKTLNNFVMAIICCTRTIIASMTDNVFGTQTVELRLFVWMRFGVLLVNWMVWIWFRLEHPHDSTGARFAIKLSTWKFKINFARQSKSYIKWNRLLVFAVSVKRNAWNNANDKLKFLTVIYPSDIAPVIVCRFLVVILMILFQFSHLIEL